MGAGPFLFPSRDCLPSEDSITLPGMTQKRHVDRFAAAFAAHQKGQLATAEGLYRAILETEPAHAEAAHLLGVLALQRNQPEAALQSFDQAAALTGRASFYHNNRGLALRMLGRAPEALREFQHALKIDARNFDAWVNLGNAHRDLGAGDEAAAAYRRALELRPNDAATLNNLGTLESDEGRFASAEPLFRQALRLDARNYEVWNNLGLALQRQDRLREARAVLEKALTLAPRSPVVLNNLGNVLQRSGELDAAAVCYQNALTSDPNYADAYGNLGVLLRERNDLGRALECMRKAIALRPSHAEYYNNLGLIYQRAGQLSAAIRAFQQAVELAPKHPQAWNNLGGAYSNIGRIDDAAAGHARAEELDRTFSAAGSNRLFCLHYSERLTNAELLAEHRKWAAKYAPTPEFVRPRRAPAPQDKARRIRLGYVSPDFRNHSVSYFIESLLRWHDRNVFELFAYSDVIVPDARTELLTSLCENWRAVASLNDAELAAQVEADRIDILVDLTGHTARHRLLMFARRPAPVQITFLGYPNTTGLDTIDFRLTDHDADPSSEDDRWCTETLSRLPRCAWCYSPPAGTPDVSVPGEAQPFTFGCFNNLAKISERCVALWSAILGAVPEARLRLKAQAFADEAVRDEVGRRFEAKGVGRGRLEMLPWQSDLTSHLAHYAGVDVALDTFPYHGTTTTCEALWMGVPVLTRVGNHHRSRVGASLLCAAGLETFVTRTDDDYIRSAITLSQKRPELADLRRQMRTRLNQCPLRDEKGYAQAIEQQYREMIEIQSLARDEH